MTRAAISFASLASVAAIASIASFTSCRQPEGRACNDCQASSGSQGGAGYVPNIVMRTYKVPPGQEKLVQRLLDGTTSYPISVVSAQGAQTQLINARPHFTGNGYFVLSAPENIQDGVKQLMEQLAATPAPPAQTSIDATYWLVVGYPAKETTVSDRLGEVAPAIKAISNLGPMKFDLLERLEVVGLDGDEVHTAGHSSDLRQTASRDADAISLRVELQTQGDQPGKVNTTLTIKPNQFVVMGQSGYVPHGHMTDDPSQLPTLFYVVRARPAN